MKLADVNMEKMNPLLQNLMAYTSHDIVFECKNQEELEESLKDTVLKDYEERIAQAYIEHACREEKSIWQDAKDMCSDYGKYADNGFAFFEDLFDDKFPFEHIEKIDELNIFDSDLEASQYAELLGVKIAHDIVFDENSPYYYYNDTILDTKENRRLYEQMKAEGDI